MKRSRGSLSSSFNELPLLEGHYMRDGKLGTGACGVVFRGVEDVGDSGAKPRYVALKQCSTDNKNWERVATNEINALRLLPPHPHIIELVGVFRGDDSVYIALELMQMDLETILRSTVTAMFSRAQIKGWCVQLLSAVAHCHAHNILHRDIKPANILVSGTNGHLRLADFGLARAMPAEIPKDGLTHPISTRWYRSHEVLLGERRYGTSADVWSVGCVVAELLLDAVLMPGRDDVDQLRLVWHLCGTPSARFFSRSSLTAEVKSVLLPLLQEKPGEASFVRTLQTENRNATRKDYFTNGAVQLIKGLLTLDPSKRTSAADALTFSYFTTEKPEPYKRNEFVRFVRPLMAKK